MDAVDIRKALHGLTKALREQGCTYTCNPHGIDNPRLMIHTANGWMEVTYDEGSFEYHWDGARNNIDPCDPEAVIQLAKLMAALDAAYQSCGIPPGQ